MNLLSRDRLKQLGTNGIQIPITKKGGELVGTKRAYEDKFATPDGKANFVARDQNWTDADPLAFLPEEIKPNDEYPYFVTTVRYQAVWQSGYTYRWTKRARQAGPLQRDHDQSRRTPRSCESQRRRLGAAREPVRRPARGSRTSPRSARPE